MELAADVEVVATVTSLTKDAKISGGLRHGEHDQGAQAAGGGLGRA